MTRCVGRVSSVDSLIFGRRLMESVVDRNLRGRSLFYIMFGKESVSWKNVSFVVSCQV